LCSIQYITFINILAKGKGSGGVKTAKLYAWVALQSLPEEMVISPCLLDFLEKALETIPITPIERNYTGQYSPHMHSDFRSYFIEFLSAITRCYIFYETPNAHTAQDFQVCVHSEMMNLTLKRLEAPGSLEVRWGGGWVHPRGDWVR
jgi:hypothetical protein